MVDREGVSVSVLESHDELNQSQNRPRSRSPLQTRRQSGGKEYEVEVTNFNKTVTEADLEELRRAMNAALVECVKEADYFKAQTKMYEEKYMTSNSKVVDLQHELEIAIKERDHYKKLSEEYLTKMNEQRDEFVEKEAAKLSQIKIQDTDLSAFEQMLTAIDDEKKDSLLQQFEGIKSMLKNYQESFCDVELLIKENKRLRAEVDAIEEGKNALKSCVHCHEKYSPIQNGDDACHFHSGRLKFYSCRGCGADEYYTCCNRCKKCNKGCKTGRHAGN